MVLDTVSYIANNEEMSILRIHLNKQNVASKRKQFLTITSRMTAFERQARDFVTR